MNFNLYFESPAEIASECLVVPVLDYAEGSGNQSSTNQTAKVFSNDAGVLEASHEVIASATTEQLGMAAAGQIWPSSAPPPGTATALTALSFRWRQATVNRPSFYIPGELRPRRPEPPPPPSSPTAERRVRVAAPPILKEAGGIHPSYSAARALARPGSDTCRLRYA